MFNVSEFDIFYFTKQFARKKATLVNPMEDRGIGFFGTFLNGRKSGKIFIGLIGEAIYGQGFLYGQVDKDGHLTGKEIAYIYPGILGSYLI